MTHSLRALVTILVVLIAAPRLAAQDYAQALDIPYRPADYPSEYARERCRLDVYCPTQTDNFPLVVWFHGGGLVGGSKFIPDELKNKGIGIVAVNYRLLPQAQIQECIDDAAAAVAWAFHHAKDYGASTRRIFVAGHSAGGYLIDMIVLCPQYLQKYGVDADSIAGAFPFSGQVITHFNQRKALGLDELTPLVDDTAPLRHVRKLPMPFILLSGDRELELYGRYEEQAYFWRMMQLRGNTHCRIYEFDGYDHGNMPTAGHPVMLRHIRAICQGQK